MRKMILAAILILALPLALAARKSGTNTGRPDPAKRCENMFKNLDSNGDGKISKDEFLAKHSWFDKLDKNKDGKVTQDEINAASAERKDPGKERLQKRITKTDTNGDGVVTLEEAAAVRLKEFERLDSNHDGVITREECQSRPKHEVPAAE